MREIKFQAWDGKIMHEWGFLEGTFIGPPSSGRGNFQTMKHRQFTGLLDKNGVEIYENDIVFGEQGFTQKVVGVVEYGGLSFSFSGKREDGEKWFYTITNPSVTQDRFVSVIGNIYQHPELLEEVK